MKYYLIFTFLFLQFSVLSQSLKGTILDSITNQKLAYVHLSIKGQNIGTFSNENGKYILDLATTKKKDSLVISLIGYQNQYIPLLRLLESKKDSLNFKMVSLPESLNEVLLQSKKLKYNNNTINLTTGNRKQTFPTSVTYGSETATLIENPKEKTGKIVALQLSFKTRTNKNFKTYQTYYGLAFYAIDDQGNPGELLHFENIIIKPKKDQKKLKLNLENKDIPITKEGVFIGIKTIKPDYVITESSMYLTTPNILYTHTNKPLKYSRSLSMDWVKHSKKSVYKKKFYTVPFIKIAVNYEIDK
ncbi:carboxypeptidase-like regulatory domain-containing protein [Winogradskyella eckloniae]|uniref:carboxypeptidase-like regulatory domain-containing protein n=1 Tax=Winogradskyella eckloniae TaxID=1089306 RepID=UPI001566121F|nr:carboxypeptidase-like regulatory domain-containing protein [Winogradskyella eckloniae]NRD20285.1 carboxypeptidase-like regulatory domain-containing protein [Winogradskyella eckloniae]